MALTDNIALPDTGFERLFNNEQTGSPRYVAQQQQQQSAIAQAQKQAGDIGFGDHLIATLAALSGNFGPAISLRERKRKTDVGRAVVPIVTKAQNLIATRDFDAADRLLSEAYGHFGPQSPEVAQQLIQLSTAASGEKRKVLNNQALGDLLLAIYPKDSVNRPTAEAISKIAKSGAPVSEDMIKILVQHLDVRSQPYQDQLIQSTGTGAIRQVPLTQAEQLSQYDPLLIQTVSYNTGLTPADIQNALNSVSGGQPVVIRGKTITPEQVEALKSQLVNGQQVIARLTLGGKVPIDPATTLAALQRSGVLKTATRELGTPESLFPSQGGATQTSTYDRPTVTYDANGRPTVTPGQPAQVAQVQQGQGGTPSDILSDIYERATETEKAKIRAQYEDNVATPRSIGQIEVIVDPSDPNYGSEGEPTSFAGIKGQKRLKHISAKDYQETVRPLVSASKALAAVNSLFKERGEPNTVLGRAGVGAANLFSDYTGVFFGENDSVAKVNQLIVNRAIEDVERTAKISDATVGSVKAAAAGGFADSKAGRRVVQQLQQRIYQQLEQYLGKGNIPALEKFGLDELLQKELGTVIIDKSQYKIKMPKR